MDLNLLDLVTHLDWPVVNEETIQLLVGLPCAIGLVKDNVGDSATNTSRSIDNIRLLDTTDSRLEVFLNRGEKSVSNQCEK